MQKKFTFWFSLLLSMFALLLSACGSSTSSGTSSPGVTATVPPGENVYVLDGYTPTGSASIAQQIVAFHPQGSHPKTVVSLPAGLTSLDHKRLYTATAENGRTTMRVVDTVSGATIRSLVINGTYSTIGQNFNNAVLSFDGHWLALRELGGTSSGTTIALVDTQAGKLAQTISLSGAFDLDAVNPDGSRIYVLERLNDASGHYYVRLYDVAAHRMHDGVIADKSEINDPRMLGTALTRQMSSDGQFAYTLYIDIPRNIAFVHVLPLTGDLYFARCLDLPVSKTPSLLRYYTLALSSDGSTLYAANGALGVVSMIPLDSNVIFNDQVTGTVHFNPNANVQQDDRTRQLHNGAVLSADNSRLYFAGIQGIMAINTSDINAQRSDSLTEYQSGQSFTGIALSADGRMLYAVDPKIGISLVNTSDGQVQQVIQGPAHSPWGIEWIAN